MPSSTEAVSGPPVRRRVPWALVPFVVAGAYVAVHAVVRHRPPLEQMVPDDAFVTWRWKDAATYDRTRTPPPGPDGIPAVPASEVLGAELNVPGLPGVDRSRPILEVWLAPEGRVDPRFFVLPVSDQAALIAKYRDPALRERHARFVEVHGAWAACAWDRNAVRTAGWSHGLFPPSIGESWCVSADWPKLVDFALQPDQAGGEPYRSALAALGFAPGKHERTVGAEGPQVAVAGGRVPFVRDAWSSVTLYSFDDRIRVE